MNGNRNSDHVLRVSLPILGGCHGDEQADRRNARKGAVRKRIQLKTKVKGEDPGAANQTHNTRNDHDNPLLVAFVMRPEETPPDRLVGQASRQEAGLGAWGFAVRPSSGVSAVPELVRALGRHVRFTPDSDRLADPAEGLSWVDTVEKVTAKELWNRNKQ